MIHYNEFTIPLQSHLVGSRFGRKGRRKVAFSLCGLEILSRTHIYIDGFNLYYSRLRGTPYKWLDVLALFRDQILFPQDPSSIVRSIKYFTAPIKASYARHGEISVQAQNEYHRALLASYREMLEIISGFHIFSPTHMPVFCEGQKANKELLSKVWMIEEKQSDVNLALHIYRDVVHNLCDQLVICTNDSDLEPVFKAIRNDFPKIKIGLVVPLRQRDMSNNSFPNKRLTQYAHWVRRHILDTELALSQLPLKVFTNKKLAKKPLHWY